MKKLLVLVLGLTAATTTYAQQLNVPKNKQFEFTTRNTQHGTFTSDEQFTYAFRSLGKNASGNTVFDCKLVKAIIKDRKGDKTILHTDSIYNTSLNSTGVLFPIAMLNNPFTVVVDPKGKVISVDGVLSSLKTAIRPWSLTPEIEKQLLENADKGFTSTMQGLFFLLPEKSLAISPQWQNKDSGTKFKLGSKNAKSIIFNASKTDTSGYSLQGKYAIDPLTGLIQHSQTDMKYGKIDDGLPAKFSGGVRSSQKISADITKPQLDTAWTNMAVKLSYWSTAIKNNLGYDSVKVQSAFEAYDQRYSKDRYYMLSKLGMVQQMRSKNSYQKYDSLLLLTPNKYLEGTHHLFNKLGEALYNEGPASAYDVSKYVYKEESFYDWLQNSMSQSFLPYDDRPNPSAGKAYELLKLFMNDKDSIYQQKANSLFLWVMAEREKKNTPLLIKNAAEFIKMSDVQMQSGNGGRYALLLHSILVKAEVRAEADSLLSHTIKKLEKYTADTKNPRRYADQNILAYAWYLKYQSALSKDSLQALQYLAKAADYSPKGNNEKAHISFYDRTFLKSKESYRQEYIDKLLSSGNEKQALKLIAVDINANPENLPEMQKIYKNRFPGKDFKYFFIQDVMASWNAAPDFKLKNIDGKEHTLADYKNKWLILDFWGTWCGPCKEELPSVNKFYTELAAGKHGDNNFLSIACNDQENKVKSFIAQNKYSIPVAMSDNKVERDYKITGYPSKILISPEGKMMNVQFGKDWKAILKQLNTIYSMN
ncbi:DUF6263 family protein [Pedobacter frigoris]|uniref:Redoxin domain-containing protein n=1 Tax=Pedobacter frigoris TaxID=2571272 RepID=A0A4U1CMU8_9SPHI|nr:DUF6263 family protein [Pedobacter frigoris]TKC08794.1 redoxin domain-containing protein [Pedobacter frigoris]